MDLFIRNILAQGWKPTAAKSWIRMKYNDDMIVRLFLEKTVF